MNKKYIRSRRVFSSGVIIAFLLLLFFAFPRSYSQPLRIDVAHVPLTQISFADIDFKFSKSTNLIFLINIDNRQSDSTYSVKLKGQINAKFLDSREIPDAVVFLSSPFDIPPGVKTITNIDISQGGAIKTEEFEINPEFEKRTRDALSANQLPPGKYTIALSLVAAQNSNIPLSAQDVVTLDIQNPSRVELRLPFNGETTNQFPLFEFFYEGSRAKILVAEKSRNQTNEEAIERRPLMWEREVRQWGSNAINYNDDGKGRLLEDGKTYVWQIQSESPSPGGGVSVIKSQIWNFNVSSSAQQTFEISIMNQIEEILRKKYPAILNQIRREGFTLTNKYTLNGKSISEVELLNFLYQIPELAEPYEVIFE